MFKLPARKITIGINALKSHVWCLRVVLLPLPYPPIPKSSTHVWGIGLGQWASEGGRIISTRGESDRGLVGVGPHSCLVPRPSPCHASFSVFCQLSQVIEIGSSCFVGHAMGLSCACSTIMAIAGIIINAHHGHGPWTILCHFFYNLKCVHHHVSAHGNGPWTTRLVFNNLIDTSPICVFFVFLYPVVWPRISSSLFFRNWLRISSWVFIIDHFLLNLTCVCL